jgi:hypothetical protein
MDPHILDLLLGYIIMFGGVNKIIRFGMWHNMFARISRENEGSFLKLAITESLSKHEQYQRLIKFCKNVIPYIERSSYLLNTAVTYALEKGIIH